MHTDARLTTVIQEATRMADDYEYSIGLHGVLAAVVASYPQITVNDALAAIWTVWRRDDMRV